MYGRISVKSYRCQRPFVPVTLRIRRYKKRGHTHELIMTVNTKGEKVERCRICKYHTKRLFLIVCLTHNEQNFTRLKLNEPCRYDEPV